MGSLPDTIGFGKVPVGEVLEQQLVVYNGCVHNITVEQVCASNDPSIEGVDVIESEFITTYPKSIEILANNMNAPMDRQSNSFNVSIYAECPVYTEGPNKDIADAEKLKELTQGIKGSRRHYVKIETVGGHGTSKSKTIPVTFQFIIKDLISVSKGKYDFIQEDNESRKINLDEDSSGLLEFGSLSMNQGGNSKIYIWNENNFAMNLEISCSEKVRSIYSYKKLKLN
jgi:hypothetical protein